MNYPDTHEVHELEGYETARETLRSTLKGDDNPPSSVVLHGPLDGLFDLAIWFSSEVEDADPERAERMKSGDDPDFELISPDTSDGDSIGVDDVRGLVSSAHRRPMVGRRRWLVVEDAGSITRKASYALLKLSEDGPDHVCLILLVENLTDLTETLRSRFVEVRAVRTRQEVASILSDKWSKEQRSAAAAASGGSVAKAESLLSGELGKLRRTAAKLILDAVTKPPHTYLSTVRDLEEPGPVMDLVLELLSDLVAYASGVDDDKLSHPTASDVWEVVAEKGDPIELAPVVEEWIKRRDRPVLEGRQLAGLLSRVWRWSRE